jgi:hypothetical protein
MVNRDVVEKLIILAAALLITGANALDVFSPKSGEVFVSQEGSSSHGTGFNEATMVMAYSCNRGAKEEAILLDPTRCRQDSKARENIVGHTIIFVPTPDEHEMFICEALMSIPGAVCSFASLQYQNIQNNDDIQLTHNTCNRCRLHLAFYHGRRRTLPTYKTDALKG